MEFKNTRNTLARDCRLAQFPQRFFQKRRTPPVTSTLLFVAPVNIHINGKMEIKTTMSKAICNNTFLKTRYSLLCIINPPFRQQ